MTTTDHSEYKEVAWAILNKDQPLNHKSIWISRPKITSRDKHQVRIETLYCGICHSDTHICSNQLGDCMYPFVGGHEILGRVVEVGSKVTKVKVGDHCAIGCMVDACLECEHCKRGDENYCENGKTDTYNGVKKHGRVIGNQKIRTHGI